MQVTAESQASHILPVQAQQLQFDTSQRPRTQENPTSPHLFQRKMLELEAGRHRNSLPSHPHLINPLADFLPIHLLDKIIGKKELMSTQLCFSWERSTRQAQSRLSSLPSPWGLYR